jgi:hypothetical protein
MFSLKMLTLLRPPAGGRQYILVSIRPPIRPYLGNVAKLIRRRRISLKRDNHPKNPSVKSMVARFEQKISLQNVTTKPTQNSEGVLITQGFEGRCHHPSPPPPSHQWCEPNPYTNTNIYIACLRQVVAFAPKVIKCAAYGVAQGRGWRYGGSKGFEFARGGEGVGKGGVKGFEFARGGQGGRR